MGSTALADLDALDQAALVSAGEVHPIELVDSAIDRISALNGELNAVIHERFERARTEARGALPDGPFRGVPLLIKDLSCETAGDPSFAGTRFLQRADWRAERDTYLAARYGEAGFICVGRTNVPEFGSVTTTEPLSFGPTKNPWDPALTPGGSSGGSAAAVAARMVPVAHGNDGGGSIRVPAGHCGLFGLKPSRGRISHAPDYGELWMGMAAEHVLSLSVRDSAAVLDACAVPCSGDPYFAPPPVQPFAAACDTPPRRLRVGVMRSTPGNRLELDVSCLAAVDNAARLLAELGHEVEEAYPSALDEADDEHHYMRIVASWTSYTVDTLTAQLGHPPADDDLEPATQVLLEMGRKFRAADYVRAQVTLHQWSRRIAAWWSGGYDLLLTPTAAALPHELGHYAATAQDPLRPLRGTVPYIAFTCPFNVSGQPAVSIPIYWTDTGVPVGVQLVAAYAREDLLFAIGAQMEAALPWRDRKPPLCAS